MLVLQLLTIFPFLCLIQFIICLDQTGCSYFLPTVWWAPPLEFIKRTEREPLIPFVSLYLRPSFHCPYGFASAGTMEEKACEQIIECFITKRGEFHSHLRERNYNGLYACHLSRLEKLCLAILLVLKSWALYYTKGKTRSFTFCQLIL